MSSVQARWSPTKRAFHGTTLAAHMPPPGVASYQQASAPVFEAERPSITVRSEPDSYGRLTSPELLLQRDSLSSYLGI